jgi:hypothetical protein
VAWLTKWLLPHLLDYLLPKLWALAAGLWNKVVRYFAQEKTAKKVEQDVEQGKIRDEETRKNEEDHLNS